MEILQLLCVTWTMKKGDPNYEHFAEHGSSRSVFSMHSSFHRNHTKVMWLGKMDRHVSKQHSYIIKVYFIFQQETYSTFQKSDPDYQHPLYVKCPL